jgi:hypothetical protein
MAIEIQLEQTCLNLLESVLTTTDELLKPIGMDEQFIFQAVLPILAEDIGHSLCELPKSIRSFHVNIKISDKYTGANRVSYATQTISLDLESSFKVNCIRTFFLKLVIF